MIDVNKQIELLKSRLHGEKVQYVVVPTINNGAAILGITKGKRFSFADYKDNLNYRRGR